ncbi:hypothetical protein D3C87_951630 [compost metagenome]
MSFLNEYIPEEDIRKYGIDEINHRFLKSDFKPDWTIDRERNIYLRQVSSGKEEFATQKIYSFFWKTSLVIVHLDEHGGGSVGGEGWSDYKMRAIDIPEELAGSKEEIIADLKSALVAFNGGGVYSRRTFTRASFDF